MSDEARLREIEAELATRGKRLDGPMEMRPGVWAAAAPLESRWAGAAPCGYGKSPVEAAEALLGAVTAAERASG